MSTPITHGELAELATQLPDGNLRDWCVASGRGTPNMTVYADREMLSLCRAAANSPNQEESNPTIEESKESEDIQRQPGPAMDPIAEPSEGSRDEDETGT
jgi:hypothetical protein